MCDIMDGAGGIILSEKKKKKKAVIDKYCIFSFTEVNFKKQSK